MLYYLGILLFLVVGEILARILQLPDPFYFFKRRKNEFLPNAFAANYTIGFSAINFVGTNQANRIEINNVGILGDNMSMEKESDEYRIVMIGGSVWGSWFQSKEKTLHHLLNSQNVLQVDSKKIKFYICSIQGNNVQLSLTYLCNRCLFLKPDMLIIGTSDLGNMSLCSEQNLFLNLHKEGVTTSVFFLLQAFLTEFHLPRLIYWPQLSKKIWKDRSGLLWVQRDYHKEKGAFSKIKEVPSQYSLENYIKAMRAMAAVCTSMQIPTVMVAPSYISSINYKPLNNGKKHAVNAVNKFLRDVQSVNQQICGDNNIYYANIKVPEKEENFMDEIHFSDIGVEIFENMLLQSLLSAFPKIFKNK